MITAAVFWGNWGPYHYARYRAAVPVMARAGIKLIGVELFGRSGVYEWDSEDEGEVVRLDLGDDERAFPARKIVTRVLPWICSVRPDIVFLPAYWHWSLLCNLTARMCGAEVVLMGETHAGTVNPAGRAKVFLRRAIIRRFSAALVSGSRQRAFYESEGITPESIFTGYSAVDNIHFATGASVARGNAAAERARLGLPSAYVLSVCRFVPKKNMGTLIDGFARAARRSPSVRHLLLVGSGEEEQAILAVCRRLQLEVVAGQAERSDVTDADVPTVHFRGFQQIAELPTLYGLAACFVLASAQEEWGLVVNEAMAAGLPVVVSNSAGCAPDLVRPGENGWTFDPASPDELATALIDVMSDPKFRKSAGARSRKLIEAFGCDRFADAAVRAALAAMG
ncbi:MAG: glycosyltransferase family 4 protein [Actinomycetota bacterium]